LVLQPGDHIDIWVIERRLGTGGMGSVYRCHNRDANRILAAIKVLETHVAKSTEARRRFVREAEILFTLEHPNIVQVRNVRVEQESPYIEMEFVRGESIEDRLASSGAIALQDALPMLGQIASALAYLHSRGVRHRDIKPANLLVEDATRQIKLVDFGLAMEADTTRLTQGTMSFGTVSYAPPEWVEPETLNPVLWDLYATGVVFWEMLTGRVAFPVSGEGSARQQAFQVVLKKQNHEPLDPGTQFPKALRDIIADLTRSDAAERLQDANLLVERLRNLEGMPDLPALPAPPPRRPPEPTIIPRDGTGNTYELGPNDTQDLRPAPTETNHAQTLLQADISSGSTTPPMMARAGIGIGVVLALLAALVVVVGGLALVVLLLWPPAPTSRSVSLKIDGLPDGLPADLTLGGRFAADRDGSSLLFSDVPLGEHEVQWAVGEDCEALACRRNACPDWCVAGWRSVVVPDGDGPVTLPFMLAAPAPRPVRVGTSELSKSWPVAIVVEGAEGEMKGPVWRGAAVAPGRYRARVVVGECPEAAPCEDACPPGCRDAVRELIVPTGQGRHEARLQISEPTPKPSSSGTSPTGSDEPTVTAPSRPKRPVTNRQYAAWIATTPAWSREAAVGSGKADGNYLFGWEDGAPPASKAGQPVQYVPHSAARAYCRRRGGLPQTTDAPTSWTETLTGLSFEWRLQGDRPASLESTGVPSTKVRPGQSLLRTGFRCAR
ncbi:MAG: protein kinase, partial [Myxococcota bacterium]